MSTSQPRIGRFLLDNVTRAMYQDPLCIYREYVQNAADSIDKLLQSSGAPKGGPVIKINIDPKASLVTIEDNGAGLTIEEAGAVLANVGESPKFGQRCRGFRGIGRLAGIAYCKNLVFTTKAPGENKETINRWDCNKVADLLHPSNASHQHTQLLDVLMTCCSFDVRPSKRPVSEGFFRVELSGVVSAKNILTDIQNVRGYLSETAPVPFNYQEFPFGRDIDARLRKEVINYCTYKLLVNDEEIFKPYRTTVRLGQQKTDTITNTTDIEVLDNANKIIGRGWLAVRKELIGVILKSERVDGVRVRVGNILLGDGDLLDKVFREERFNGYFVGEIHAVDPGLVPNGRRDDFEPSKIREVFYDSLQNALGNPLSRMVRSKSNENSKTKAIKKAKELCKQATATLDKGFVGTSHAEQVITDLRNTRDELAGLNSFKSPQTRSDAQNQIKKCDELLAELEAGASTIAANLSSKYSKREKDLLARVFEHVFTAYPKAQDPERLCALVVQKLNSDADKQAKFPA